VDVKTVDTFMEVNKQEYIYTYNDNAELLSSEKYNILEDGSKELYLQETFSKEKETYLYLVENDTITFIQRYFDTRGNEVEDSHKVMSLDLNIHDKGRYKYDDNNRLVESITEDYVANEITTSTISYETKQDTFIKRIYADGELGGVVYTVLLDENHTAEYTYNSDNLLEYKEEILLSGESKTVINNTYAAGLPNVVESTDTIYYLNEKEIESIMMVDAPELKRRRVTTNEYDNFGNLIRTTEKTWFTVNEYNRRNFPAWN
jgi:hypothetical protein